ncbi:PhoH family protein [Paraburkholderia bonniea]|uniref:PhoH family protein n=1 Tax=Paraburkholderia bonniea TaxID=2152891 RepID=UPI0012927195|nr:PhoH family protein [Paraburkholderia bonniea]WJF90730.1 PhoH family protein [Paraburkholderia bonniea]WJF94043.1 PhoH family protein [Paraburkholderia bonniea]
MKPTQPHLEFTAPHDDNARLANLCGPLDENLRQIEQALDVTLTRRGHRISIRGRGAKIALAALENFYHRTEGDTLSVDDIQLALVEMRHPANRRSAAAHASDPADAHLAGNPDHPFDELALNGSADAETLGPKLYTRRADLRGRTPAQREYLKQIIAHDVTFGVGPAGTGKTYLAVACAVDALERDQVKRIVLTRPAVEAGERLGFLPGDLAQKVDPYLRPLYDALYDLLGFDKTAKMFERQMIEIAPLAYMRGRTLNHAFIILDEAQNTTPEQMKMFLTRIGFGSKAVVTGDTTQVDLPRGHKSGLIEAQKVLADVRGIALTRFTSADVVRHPLVARIVDAYDAHAQKDQKDAVADAR